MKRRSWGPGRRVGVAGLALLVFAAAVLGLAAFRVRGAVSDLERAIDLIDDASLALEEGRLANARSALDQAYGLISKANGDLYGTAELDVSAAVPLAGANLRAVRDGVALATRLVDGGRRILQAAAPLEGDDGKLEVSLEDGTLSLEAVATTQQEIRSLVVQLPGGDPDIETGVIGPLADATRSLYTEANRRRDQLGVLDRGLSLLTELAGGNGDRTYLLAVSNTAEMRGSGGMVLDYGILTGSKGTIDLQQFGRIDELAFAGAVDVPGVPSDYLARWSGFDPLSRWRQANLAGDFTVVAPVLEAMYARATGKKVDGVVQIDPSGLAKMLHGLGPIDVAGLGQVNEENAVALTLNEAYLRFPGIEDRTDVLGDVAEGAFRRLVDGDIPSLRALAEGMVEAVDARHVLMHASSPAMESELVAFGADGALPPVDQADSFQLTAQNLAGNKLDYYLDTSLGLAGSMADGAVGDLTATVALANRAPAGATQPPYVFGPGPTAVPLPPGVLRSVVTLYVPFGTTLVKASGDATVEPATSGTEAGRPYVSFVVDVPAEASRTVALELRTPPKPTAGYAFLVLPSPRVRPTGLDVAVATDAGDLDGSVELDRPWVFAAGRAPAPSTAPAFR
ncbi:MAG: DUF4012 domain-containing protein [Acidimicrobiales bacterium]